MEHYRQCITEQRHHFAHKGPYSQRYGFSSNHVWMWELDHKEGCENESHSVVSNSLWSHRLCSPWNSPGQNTGVGNFSFSRGSSQPQGLNPGLPTSTQILYEPQGKPKNTGVGSRSLLQQIFPNPELNQGLLHCRWILYQLSYQGSQIAAIKTHL